MRKFTGPCEVCGKPDSSGDYKKHKCNNCYRKVRRRQRGLQHGGFPKKLGPCSNCGTEKSSNGRLIKGMCVACYKRINNSGNKEPRKKFSGPCKECGKCDEKTNYYDSLCARCYQLRKYALKVKSIKKFCSRCEKQISRTSKTGFCLNCRLSIRYAADPAYRQKVKGKNKLREVQKRGAGVITLTAYEWQEVLNHFGNSCAYCGTQSERLEIDHYIPLSKGGTHTQDNVVPACRSCNAKKHAGKPLRVTA